MTSHALGEPAGSWRRAGILQVGFQSIGVRGNDWRMKGGEGAKGRILSPPPSKILTHKDYTVSVTQQRHKFIYVVHSWFQ